MRLALVAGYAAGLVLFRGRRSEARALLYGLALASNGHASLDGLRTVEG